MRLENKEMIIKFKKIVASCMIINLLSLVVFISGGRSYGELYLGAIQIFGVRSIIGAGLAVVNIIVCIVFLKTRRALLGKLPIKCSKLGAVFGILAAVFTVIFEMGFIPFASGGWDWIHGNVTGLLFALPIFFTLIVISTIFFIVVQLGFYLTAITLYILLFSKLKEIS